MSESDPHAPARLPALFVGHGSPMNCVADNAFTRDMRRLGAALPRPAAVLVVSAHWLTRGVTRVTGDAHPETIHDFFGFPQELYELRYPAPGSPRSAARVRDLTGGVVEVAANRGLDHAAWMVLRNVWPTAHIPVLELSLDLSLSPEEHYALGRRLMPLRDEGVLIMGSGNIVHNLSQIDWAEDAPTAAWAIAFDDWVRIALDDRRHDDLIAYDVRGPLARRAHPTADHYLPLLYTIALQGDNEEAVTIHESFQHATISMRSLRLG